MKITKEIKIALVGVISLVLLFFGMNFLKGLNLFNANTEYIMSFENISGLSSGSVIYADGYKVGSVKRINYDYDKQGNIEVVVGIDPSLRIPKGSKAEIQSDLLGNTQVNLLMANNPRERLEPGQVITGVVNNGTMGQLKDMVPVIEKMLPKLDSILASLNTLLADPAIAQTLHNVQTVSGNLTTTTHQLNTLMASLNRDLPATMKKVDVTLGSTQQLMENVNGQVTQVDVAGTMEKVNATLKNVEQLTAQLNSNEGTLGLLMRDPQLYIHLNTTMLSADSLLVNLREHPKRYVHFSIFGKKDK